MKKNMRSPFLPLSSFGVGTVTYGRHAPRSSRSVGEGCSRRRPTRVPTVGLTPLLPFRVLRWSGVFRSETTVALPSDGSRGRLKEGSTRSFSSLSVSVIHPPITVNKVNEVFPVSRERPGSSTFALGLYLTTPVGSHLRGPSSG